MRYRRASPQDIENLRGRGIEVEDHSITFERRSTANVRRVSGYFREYKASGDPEQTLGQGGDIWLDLSKHLLYTNLDREWIKWTGVNPPNSDTMSSWGQFKKYLMKYPVHTLDYSIPQGSFRYLWCNQQGVHWWTLDQISADRENLTEVPRELALRDNGRWIVKQLLESKQRHVEPPDHAQVGGVSAGKRPSGADANEENSAKTASASRGPAKKKQRVERRSASTDSGRVTSAATMVTPKESLAHVSEWVDTLLLKLREAEREPDEGADDLKRRLEAAELELEKARQEAAKYEIMYNELNGHVDALEEALLESRETARKHEQEAKDAQERYSGIASVQHRAAQLLKRQS